MDTVSVRWKRAAGFGAILIMVVALHGQVSAPTEIDDEEKAMDSAYGPDTEEAWGSLLARAKVQGVDLESLYASASGGSTKSLSAIFDYCEKVQELDTIGRTYGRLLFNSFLNLAEDNGLAFYASALNSRSAAIKQRVRDFILLPVAAMPAEARTREIIEAKSDYPEVFPAEYKFGDGNDLLD